MARRSPPGDAAPPAGAGRLRIDKWLWQARFFRSRSLATAVVAEGHCRLNGQHVAKPAAEVAIGDVLTFAQGSRIRVVRISALGLRRGSAPEASALYVDLDQPAAEE